MTRVIIFFLLSFLSINSWSQNPVNWTKEQLMEPSELALSIKEGKDIPNIICIGPGAPIPHSIDIGMVNHATGIETLKTNLSKLSKESKIVIYCGCCPFEHCPNVRPAIDILNEMKFTDYYLLNLSHNIKTDWIDKGYPVKK